MYSVFTSTRCNQFRTVFAVNSAPLSVSSNGNGADLPRPNAEVRLSGDEGEWTAEQIRGIIGNPIYAGIGPFPSLVDDKAWVRAAAASIDQDGKEQFLVNLLALLRKALEGVEFPLSDVESTGGPLESVLIVHNRHSAECGGPPGIVSEPGGSYIGYFENPYGEQWVFTFNRTTGESSLRGGDAGWENVYRVRDGRAEGLNLGREEAAWLANCWAAATFGVGDPT